jgi:ADP-ribose pyrophosphatase YjhB (NUDIX family)
MGDSSRQLVGLLAEPARLQVVAALTLGARSQSGIVAATGLDARTVAAACRRLEAGGLVSTVDGELRLDEAQFGEAARAEAPARPVDDYGATDPVTAAVLRGFLREGRLVRIPAAHGKRRVVLQHIAMVFEPGVRYPERQVNAMLRAWHPDYASLRRYLVDEQLLARDAGEYWRAGGWVDVEAADALADHPMRRERRVGAYGLCVDESGRVLLVQLAGGRHRGLWTLPGGGIDFGERPVEAVVREVREETGLAVRVGELLDVDTERVVVERNGELVERNPLRILYRVHVVGGALGAHPTDGTTTAAAWHDRSTLDDKTLTPYSAAVLGSGRYAG